MSNFYADFMYAPLMYGLPYSSNLFTKATNSGKKTGRGWSSSNFVQDTSPVNNPNSLDNYHSSSGDGGGNLPSMNFSYATGSSRKDGWSNPYQDAWTSQGLKDFVGGIGMNAGVTAGAGALAGLPLSQAIGLGLSAGFNPGSMFSGLGGLAATSIGVQSNPTANAVISTLGGLAFGPIGGLIAGAAAPFISEGIADAFNQREHEKVRDTLEDMSDGYRQGRTLGTVAATTMDKLNGFGAFLGNGSIANYVADQVNRAAPPGQFDPIASQAIQRAVLEENGITGWEAQATINNARFNPEVVGAIAASMDVLGEDRAKAVRDALKESPAPVTSVQGAGTVAQTLTDLAQSSFALSNPAVSDMLNTAQTVLEATSLGQQSFAQPEMSSSNSVGQSYSGSDASGFGFSGNSGSGGGGHYGGSATQGAIGSVGFNSSGQMTGGWSGGGFGFGSNLGLSGSLGSDAISGGGHGGGGIGGANGTGGSVGGKDTGNSSSGKDSKN